MPAVINHSPTPNRKNAGGGNQLIHEEPEILALGDELHARRAEIFGGDNQPTHDESKISAVETN